MTKIILPLLSIFALATANAARAECLSFYQNEIKNHEEAITKLENSRSSTSFDAAITSSGIPYAVTYSEVSSEEAKLDKLHQVADILKEANIGGGIALIGLRKDLGSKAKVDLDTLAAAVRDANEKNYFCTGHELATYDQVKTVVENLLTP